MSAPGDIRASKDTRDDWETPQDLFDKLDKEFNFTIDAAADDMNRKCERYLTEAEDALMVDFINRETIWINPPYGRTMPLWVAAFGRWAGAGSTVVALLPANTDTKWFEQVWRGADEIRFLTGRVSFVGTTSSNTGGSMVAIYRPGIQIPDRPSVRLWNWK